MATIQRTAQEIQVEQITTLVASLTAEQKAKESAIRELNSQIGIVSAELASKTALAIATYDQERARLQDAIVPLRDQLSVAQKLTQDIARLRQEKIDAVSEIRAAKGGVLKEISDHVTGAKRRLAELESAIHACKVKVAAL